MEALRLVERGDASKEDVDIAMKLGAGYRKFSILYFFLCSFFLDFYYDLSNFLRNIVDLFIYLLLKSY